MLASATVDTRMSVSEVKDVVRAMFLCDSERQLLQVYEAVLASEKFGVARFKNFFRHLGPTHFRRISFNVRVKLPDGGSHVCELQVAHTLMLNARASLPGHAVYDRARNAVELLGKQLGSGALAQGALALAALHEATGGGVVPS